MLPLLGGSGIRLVSPGAISPLFAVTRAGAVGSDITYLDAGAANSFAANTPRFRRSTGRLLIEEARTNAFLNSDAPATQSPTLGTGNFCLWLFGAGSATVAAGTATGTGFGVATQGSPVVFNLSVGGTVSVTIAGGPTRVQLENGDGPTSYIATAGATVTRNADVISMPYQPFMSLVAGSIVAKASIPQQAASVPRSLAMLWDGSNSNRAVLRNAGTVTLNGLTVAGGVTQVNATTGNNYTPGTAFKSALAFDAAGASVVHSGGTVATGAGTLPTFTTGNLALLLGAGGLSSFGPLNGELESLDYFPVRLPDAQLAALSR